MTKPYLPSMNFKMILAIAIPAWFAVTSVFAQEVDFKGDWEGFIKVADRADSEVKLSIQDGIFAQYYKREGKWVQMRSSNQYYKKIGDILLVGWIDQSKVWTENQMFSLSYLGRGKVKVVWTRHVTNRKGDEIDTWSHRGEGELLRGGSVVATGQPILGNSILGKTFEIQRLGTDKQDAFVEGGWRNGTECIEVKFSVAPDMKSSDIILKAYFFNSAGEQVHMLDYPSQISDSNQETSTIPLNIDAGERYTVFFAIPERFNRGSKRWRRAIVVLGDKQQVVAEVYPKDDISKFSFPEKGRLKSDKRRR